MALVSLIPLTAFFSHLLFQGLDMGENPTMFMRQAKHNENCHVGNSCHAFSVFGQITPIKELTLLTMIYYLRQWTLF